MRIPNDTVLEYNKINPTIRCHEKKKVGDIKSFEELSVIILVSVSVKVIGCHDIYLTIVNFQKTRSMCSRPSVLLRANVVT